MELEKFIGQTLTEIAKGINIANGQTRKNGNTPFMLDCSTGAIFFDIAVTVSNEASASAEGSVKVIAVNVEGDIDTSQKHERVSRIQFRVTPNENLFCR